MLPRLFDMFTQVDRSLERSQGGLGIGLAIVKRLVQMHGGSVTAYSAGVGTGSRFVVRLPWRRFRRAEMARCEGRPTGPPVRRRILVVDDNEDSAISMAMLLTGMGNETRTAHEGLEALEIGATFLPEVILLDIGMPRLNGYDRRGAFASSRGARTGCSRRLREGPGRRPPCSWKVVFIITTGQLVDPAASSKSLEGRTPGGDRR